MGEIFFSLVKTYSFGIKAFASWKCKARNRGPWSTGQRLKQIIFGILEMQALDRDPWTTGQRLKHIFLVSKQWHHGSVKHRKEIYKPLVWWPCETNCKGGRNLNSEVSIRVPLAALEGETRSRQKPERYAVTARCSSEHSIYIVNPCFQHSGAERYISL